MKMKTKRFVGFLLSLALVLGLIPGMTMMPTARAFVLGIEIPIFYQIKFGETEDVTNTHSSGAGWAYDVNTNTLKLNGFNYTGHKDGIAYWGTKDLNIELTGTNTIDIKQGNNPTRGIFVNVQTPVNLIFSGTGSLTVISEGNNAIYSKKGDIIFEGGTVNAKGAQIGILSDNGKIVINGGSVTASGGNEAITTVKNAIPGTGWTDVEGTVGETAIPVNTEGQSVKAYKKVQFLQPPDPDPAPTPVSTTALTAAPTAAPTSALTAAPTAVPTATPKPVPKTGDSANLLLWLGLILLGLAGISALAVSKVRK